MKDGKYTITNLINDCPAAAGTALGIFTLRIVLMQPPNAVTRSRREYHYFTIASLLCKIAFYFAFTVKMFLALQRLAPASWRIYRISSAMTER